MVVDAAVEAVVDMLVVAAVVVVRSLSGQLPVCLRCKQTVALVQIRDGCVCHPALAALSHSRFIT